jgi:hypothetical protein
VTIWPVVVPIVVVTAVMLLIGGIPRYRAAAEPSIIVLAALGVGAFLLRRSRRGDPAPAPAPPPVPDGTRVASPGTGP